MSPAITELIMIFDLLRNFLFDSDKVKVLYWPLLLKMQLNVVCSNRTLTPLLLHQEGHPKNKMRKPVKIKH